MKEEFEPYDAMIDYGRQKPRRARILTPPSDPIPGLTPPYENVGKDYVQADIEQPSGFWARIGIHIRRILGGE